MEEDIHGLASITLVYKVPLWGCGWLEIPGVSQAEKWEDRRSYVYKPM